MRTRRLLVLLAALSGVGALPSPAFAQATKDQARLVFTVSAGAVGGTRLWSVSNQAVQSLDPADTFALGRRIRSTLVFGAGGAYFPGEHLGFTVEAFLIGLGFEDSCRHVFASGSSANAEVCQSIEGKTKAATSVILSGGMMYRVNSRKLLSPYGRVNLGLALSNQSSLRTSGEFVAANGIGTLEVYSDDRNTRIDPSLALGVGLTAAIGNSSNIRWEIRDNITGVQQVTGTIPVYGSIPPHKRVFKHLFGMTVGFDMVLERRKGRRY